MGGDGALVGSGSRRPRRHVPGQLRLPDRRVVQLWHAAHRRRDLGRGLQRKVQRSLLPRTHHRDPVVQLPPDQLIGDWHFEHVEPEIFYNGHVSEEYVGCGVADDKTCSEQYWDIAIDALNLDDHLTCMDVDTAVFGCPGAHQV